MDIAPKYLQHVEEWKVVVCKQCRHAVWPREIRAHFKGVQHRLPSDEIKGLVEEVSASNQVTRDHSVFQYPAEAVEPIEAMPIFDDGLMCTFAPDECRYICRSEKYIKQHAKDEHGFVQFRKRHRPSQATQRRVQQRRPTPWKRVACQVFFKSNHGRRFFQVNAAVPEDAESTDEENAIIADFEQAMEEATKARAEAEEEVLRVIEESEITDANPWLRRTGWSTYLKDLDREELMQCMDEPEGYEDEEAYGLEKSRMERRKAERREERKAREGRRRVRQEDERRRRRRQVRVVGEEGEGEAEGAKEKDEREERAEKVDAAIWKAMDSMVVHCQETVRSRVAHMVRMEVIRTEKFQTRYEPLQTYMDAKTICRHARSWKQVMMFFARTRRMHGWKSPAYKFSAAEKNAWKMVIRQANMRVDAGGCEEDEGQSPGRVTPESEGGAHSGAAESESTTKQELDAFENALLDFCLTLLKRKVRSQEYELPLVCALAVLGVQEGGWRWVDSYPPILSDMIKLSRFFVAQKAHDMTEASPDPQDSQSDDDEVDDEESEIDEGVVLGEVSVAKGTVDHACDMMDEFMTRGSHSAVQWMLDLRTYGMKVWFSTTAEGKVDWKGDDTVLYRDLQFTMRDLRGFMHSLVAQASRVLHEELMFIGRDDKALPKVPWKALVDNPINSSPRWNFIQDERNPWPVDGSTWLKERIRSDVRLAKRFRQRSGNEWSWKRADIEQYMEKVVEFRAKLMVLMHITAGQPARGTELTTIRHSNTAGGQHRNVFVEDGRVVFVTRYHKGYNIKGDVKIIHRYLPRDVGGLYVKYMWLVLPFQQEIELAVYGSKADAISAHVWPGDPVTGKRWEKGRLTKEMKEASGAGMGQKVGVQAWRDLAIAISRKFLRGKDRFKPDEGDEDGVDEDEEDATARAADEQAGHESHVAGIVYARHVDEMSGAVASKRRRFLLSSQAWQAFMQFRETDEEEGSRGVKREADGEGDGSATQARMARWKRVKTMDPSHELKRVAGESATFRGVQQAAIQSIIGGKSPVVAVMATGQGKSMLFMLPALCGRGGQTVVVVPLIALRQDMVRRCSEFGIICKEWDVHKQPYGADVVLVTPESAVSDAFWTFLIRARRSQQLDRIVVDECHVVLNRSRSFRPAMARLGELTGAETQMVLLTATLPPQEEEELWRRMGFDADRVFMFRARTTRKNIRYGVVRCEEGDEAEDARTEEVVAKVREEIGEAGKMVVYCKRASKVKRLAERFNCEAYHNQAQDKARKMQEFHDGKQTMIVATSALGLGIDIPDIRAVIHADVTRNLLDYAQESGRAGRDGQASQAIVVVAEGWEQDMEFDWKDETEGAKEKMRCFIEAEGCRRSVLDEYFDGVEDRRGCIVGEEEFCDRCEEMIGVGYRPRRMAGAVESRERKGENEDAKRRDAAEREEFQRYEYERKALRRTRQDEIKMEGEEWEGFKRELSWWKGRCAVCWSMGERGWEHTLEGCPSVYGQSARRAAARMREKVRYEKNMACWECGTPQAICRSWREKEGGGGFRFERVAGEAQCQYRNVIIDALAGMRRAYPMEVEPAYQRRLKEAGVRKGDGEGEGSWLGGGMVWFDYDCPQSAREFYEAAKCVRGIEEQGGEDRERGGLVEDRQIGEEQGGEEQGGEEQGGEEQGGEEQGGEEQGGEEMKLELDEGHNKGPPVEEERGREKRTKSTQSLVALIEEWVGKCAVCYMRGLEVRSCMHTTHTCEREQARMAREEVKKLRAAFRAADGSGCRGCGLPFAVCDRWEETRPGWFEMKVGERCQARYVLVDVVAAVMCLADAERNTVIDWMQREEVNVDVWDEVVRWFGKKEQWFGVTTNRLARVFEGLAFAYSRQRR